MEKADKKSNYGFINGEMPFINSINYVFCTKLKKIADTVLHMVSIEEFLKNDLILINNIFTRYSDIIEEIENEFINVYEFSNYGFTFREFMALIFSALYKIEPAIVVDEVTNSINENEIWHNFIPIAYIKSEIEFAFLLQKIDNAIVKANNHIYPNNDIGYLHDLAANTLTNLDIALEDMKIPFNSEVVLTVLIREIICHLELASEPE
jgi:hypothetical protein